MSNAWLAWACRSQCAKASVGLGCAGRARGKTVLLGVLDLGDPAVEKLEVVAERIRAGLRWVSGSGWYRLQISA